MLSFQAFTLAAFTHHAATTVQSITDLPANVRAVPAIESPCIVAGLSMFLAAVHDHCFGGKQAGASD